MIVNRRRAWEKSIGGRTNEIESSGHRILINFSVFGFTAPHLAIPWCISWRTMTNHQMLWLQLPMMMLIDTTHFRSACAGFFPEARTDHCPAANWSSDNVMLTIKLRNRARGAWGMGNEGKWWTGEHSAESVIQRMQLVLCLTNRNVCRFSLIDGIWAPVMSWRQILVHFSKECCIFIHLSQIPSNSHEVNFCDYIATLHSPLANTCRLRIS